MRMLIPFDSVLLPAHLGGLMIDGCWVLRCVI